MKRNSPFIFSLIEHLPGFNLTKIINNEGLTEQTHLLQQSTQVGLFFHSFINVVYLLVRRKTFIFHLILDKSVKYKAVTLLLSYLPHFQCIA